MLSAIFLAVVVVSLRFFSAVEEREREREGAVAVLWRCLEVVAMSIPVAHATRLPCR